MAKNSELVSHNTKYTILCYSKKLQKGSVSELSPLPSFWIIIIYNIIYSPLTKITFWKPNKKEKVRE